jgi:hypothetical protein
MYSANANINSLEKKLFIHDNSESLPRVFFCSLSWSLEKKNISKINNYSGGNIKIFNSDKLQINNNDDIKNHDNGYVNNDDHNSDPNNWGYGFSDHELIIIKREKIKDNNYYDNNYDNNYDNTNNVKDNNYNNPLTSPNIINPNIEYDYQIIQGYIESETENGYNLSEWQNSKNQFSSKTGFSKKKMSFFFEKLKLFIKNDKFDCVNHKDMFNVYSNESKNEKYFPCFSYREFDDRFIEGYGERPMIDKMIEMIKTE